MAPGQQAAQEAARFVAKVNQIILFPTIMLLFGVAFLIFLWGCAQYIFNSAESSAHEEGRRHILWGIVGMVIMLSAYGIVRIAAATFGLDPVLDCATNPNAGGCSQIFQVQPPTVR